MENTPPVQRLLRRDDVHVVRPDQCQFSCWYSWRAMAWQQGHSRAHLETGQIHEQPRPDDAKAP